VSFTESDMNFKSNAFQDLIVYEKICKFRKEESREMESDIF